MLVASLENRTQQQTLNTRQRVWRVFCHLARVVQTLAELPQHSSVNGNPGNQRHFSPAALPLMCVCQDRPLDVRTCSQLRALANSALELFNTIVLEKSSKFRTHNGADSPCGPERCLMRTFTL